MRVNPSTRVYLISWRRRLPWRVYRVAQWKMPAHNSANSPPWKAALPFWLIERKERMGAFPSLFRNPCPKPFNKLPSMRKAGLYPAHKIRHAI